MKKLIHIGSYNISESEYLPGDLGVAIEFFEEKISDEFGTFLEDMCDNGTSWYEWAYGDEFQAIYISDEPDNIIGSISALQEKMAYCVDYMEWNWEQGKEEWCKHSDKLRTILDALKGGEEK